MPPRGCTFIDAVITDCRIEQGTAVVIPSVSTSNTDTGDHDIEDDGSTTGSSAALDGTARLMCIHALQLQRGTAYNVHQKQVNPHIHALIPSLSSLSSTAQSLFL